MLRLVVTCLLATAGPAFAMDAPPLEDAAKDAKGIIWACNHSEGSQLYTFDGSQWVAREAPVEGGDNVVPKKMARMTDGSVACIWRVQPNVLAVTRHLGTESRLLGTCPIAADIFEQGQLADSLADSQDRLWITGEFAQIYRADGKGGVAMVHEIAPAELKNPGNLRSGYNKIHAVEDGHGRVWVWSQYRASNWARLRGILLFTGDKVERRDPCLSIPGAKIVTIARADDRHMWITVENDGIYKIDIDTFGLERMPDPSPHAFTHVEELFTAGSDLLAVQAGSFNSNSLWRLRAGKWTPIIESFDLHENPWTGRSVLPIKEGLLVQSFGRGPWFIPHQGPPALLSWATGFPLEDAHALIRRSDGTFFAIGREQLFQGALSLPPRVVENSRVLEYQADRGWNFDAAGHAWNILPGQPRALNEWDGSKWVPHPIPGDGKSPYIETVMADTAGRIWVMSQPIQVYDSKSGQWQSFPDLSGAYLAYKDSPPQFLHEHWPMGPQYSRDRQRVAYRRGVIEVNYYDGTAWKKMVRKDIVGKADGDNAVGPPWFDDAGKLRVNLRQKMSWQMDDSGQWSQVAYGSHFPTDIWSEESRGVPPPTPPEGCVTSSPESIVVDNRGTTWLTWKGGLYKCIPGACVSVFGTHEINPFRVPRQLRDVEVDSQGNAFLQTAAYTMDWFIIRPKGPPPATQIAMKMTGEDSCVALLNAHTRGPVIFRWALDDGAWQSSKADSVALDHLPNGTHVLKVIAMNDQLDADPTPVTVRFETKIDSARQLRELVAQLMGADYGKRKVAVSALAQQPDPAIALLQKTRETADDEQRWWIEVAIQECERNSPKTGKKAGP